MLSSRIKFAAMLGGLVLLLASVVLRHGTKSASAEATQLGKAAEHSPESAPNRAVAAALIEFSRTALQRSAKPSQSEVTPRAKEPPAWAIGFGKEFWRASATTLSAYLTGQGAALQVSPSQVGNAIDRVTHAFRSDATGWVVSASDSTYRAALDSAGLAFTSATLGDGSHTGATARFRTRSVACGTRSLLASDPRSRDWHVTGNTAQALLGEASGLVEHYEARQAGVEVTWLVTRPLAGARDLAIEAELTGVQFDRQTDSGLHYAGPDGVARVRIGPVLAVDSSRRSWPLTLQAAGNVLRVVVPGAVLAAASFPLAIDPIISPEAGVDQPVNAPSPCTRAAPTVAANDSGYLVVWTHGKGDATDVGVYGARLDPVGNLLDPYGIRLSIAAGEQSRCAVAANPGVFLAVWSNPRTTAATDWDVLGARVLPDGTVLDTTPIGLCRSLTGARTSPTVAANGTNFLAVWRDSRNTGIYGTTVSTDGVVSPVNGLSLSSAANEQFTPSAAALGGNYFVVWQDYRKASANYFQSDIYGARITGSGSLVDTTGIAICTRTNSQYHPAVAANGANYLVVWEDYDQGGNDIFGARVGADGVLLDTNALMLAHATNSQANPAVAANDGDFLVVWQDYRACPTNNFEARVFGTRVPGDGSAAELEGVAFSDASGGQTCPAVARRGDEFLVTWQDFRNNPGTTLADIYGVRVSSTTNLGAHPDALVSGAANAEIVPAVAGSGTGFLAVWADSRNAATAGRDIFGVLLAADGSLLDSVARPICMATNSQTDPTVAANGTNYLVAWSDWRHAATNFGYADIYGTLLSGAGVVLQPEGLAICNATNDQVQPAATALGTNFLVVWQDSRATIGALIRQDIRGTRVGSGGDVLDPTGLPICTNAANQTAPAVAASYDEALVVWADARSGSGDIYGARVLADGTISDTNNLLICLTNGAQTLPAVAANGPTYFVAWADWRNGGTYAPDIYGTLVVDGVAVPQNGYAIRQALLQQTAPTVAFNGDNYLVAWQEARSGLSNSLDICAARIGLDGSPLGSPFWVNTNVNSQLAPSVVAAADGRFLILHQGFRHAAFRATANILELEARLDSCAYTANGDFQFRLQGIAGQRYAIEASEDLVNWFSLLTLTNTTTSVFFTNTAPGSNLPCRFYRAIRLP